MSKKRKREPEPELVQIYNDLADYDETIRHAAARTLVTKIFKPGVTSDDQTRTVLTRLFRGTCSGRKAARLGFSIALTELLYQLIPSDAWPAATIVDMLETLTVPESGTTADDERNHCFGRLFSASAVLRSDILFAKPEPLQWRRVLELICDLAIQKPWLRQQCGWVLVDRLNSVATKAATKAATKTLEEFAINAVEVLDAKKIVRSPEGLALWLTITTHFPRAKLLNSVWKYGDPLAMKNAKLLADVLKDARTLPQDDSDIEAQGSARWSQQLHFAWDVVLSQLSREHTTSPNDSKNGTDKSSKHERITFEIFWQKVVDESLFSPTSSHERKYWGFAVWEKVFTMEPQRFLRFTFTPRATSCLANSLKVPKHLLRKRALKTSENFHTRLNQEEAVSLSEPSLTETCIKALLRSVDYGNFDQLTKTNTMESLFDSAHNHVLKIAADVLMSIAAENVSDEEEKQVMKRQKTVIDLQSQIVRSVFNNAQQTEGSDEQRGDVQIACDIMYIWLLESSSLPAPKSYAPELLEASREHMKDRLGLAFEHTLKLEALGCRILMDTMLRLKPVGTHQQSVSSRFEESVYVLVQQAWKRLSDLSGALERLPQPFPTDKVPTQSYPTLSHGLSLLYCLLLFQIYIGDTDAVELLQDVLEYQQHWEARKPKGSSDRTAHNPADAMVEIILSFASRPSKFLRSITVRIFEAFAPFVTGDGLESLWRVLEAKENTQGQQAMFQEGGLDVEDSEDASVDSDVEVESLPDAEGLASGEHESISSSEKSSQLEHSGDEEDEELAAFDAALASALGTRPFDQNGMADASISDSSSDIDMDDDEMLELDTKLAEVFRLRNAQHSRNKKKETKQAKENVVNFKNRVLDLIESYLDHQRQNPLALHLIVPLLELARTTRTQQLAHRGCEILQKFYNRRKGLNMTFVDGGFSNDDAIQVLQSIHDEACTKASNAHLKAASQASILLLTVLVNADPSNIGAIVEIYATTRLRQLTEKQCQIPSSFFTEWNNWCQTAREKLAA
ncbi:DNA-directed DNA polymerase [Exophiala oligosperma]